MVPVLSAVTRVTLVTYDDDPPLGGQGVEARGMRAALEARDVTVTTIAGRGHAAIPFRRLSRREPLDFSLHLNRHPGLIRETTPDVVHALGGPGGVLLLRRLEAPLVYTANHTYRMAHDMGSVKRVMSPLEAHAYRAAAMVLAISTTTADAVRGLGVPANRVEVLAPGVDVPDVPTHRDQLRILFAGRWEPEKGVLDAVAVMRDVIAQVPGAAGAVVGGGHLEAQVRSLASTVPGVEVLGRVSDQRLAAEYARAAVVLMPSRYEGLGLAALEGQAHGAVVVGYDVDGLRDAVAHRHLLVPEGDMDAMARAVLRLAGDLMERDALASAAQHWVAERHSWAAVAERLEQVYAAVTSGR